MAEKTSIRAYRQAVEEGLVNDLCLRVMEVLCHAKDAMTSREVHSKISKMPKYRHTTPNTVSPRFAELVDRGAIEEQGTDKCAISGKQAKLFKPTGKAPTKRPKKFTWRKSHPKTAADRLRMAEDTIKEFEHNRGKPTREQAIHICTKPLRRLSPEVRDNVLSEEILYAYETLYTNGN